MSGNGSVYYNRNLLQPQRRKESWDNSTSQEHAQTTPCRGILRVSNVLNYLKNHYKMVDPKHETSKIEQSVHNLLPFLGFQLSVLRYSCSKTASNNKTLHVQIFILRKITSILI